MSLISIHWDIDVLAHSSIVHCETYSGAGTDNFALFRREKIISAAGETIEVPIVSGSSFRGILRRIGESLTAAALTYEDTPLPVPAAHLLTNGGRLAKSARPLTDEDERRLKHLLPQIAVFGGAAGGRIMEGLAKVGKVLPEIAEITHILPRPPQQNRPLPALLALAEESFVHLPDHRPDSSRPAQTDHDDASSPLGSFGVETLPAGTRLQTWVRLTNATPTQAAFLAEVLEVFAHDGHLGGRTAAGHGRITATLTAKPPPGKPVDATTEAFVAGARADWRTDTAAHRADAIAALCNLT